ncbi:GNAT family N-acetyltransferase [Kurthia massiliensis]|uniref:GNAT family N-acetyltransferase n=1 Tax=Kurthia massiliensis TaxID=1033739 RepID=UPI00028861DB|nr:GNAT family N-acetyltransferase [Kurthia massiliensis]
MLYRYKKAFEKIAMGLLSFMPEEKNLKVLQQTIRTYDSDPNWQLYLWKRDEDYIGLVGVEKLAEEWVVRHITVDPSHRGEGVGRSMLTALAAEESCGKLVPCDIVQRYYDNVATKIAKENAHL